MESYSVFASVTVSVSFIPVVAFGRAPFLFEAESQSTIWVYFVCPSIPQWALEACFVDSTHLSCLGIFCWWKQMACSAVSHAGSYWLYPTVLLSTLLCLLCVHESPLDLELWYDPGSAGVSSGLCRVVSCPSLRRRESS